MCIHCINYQKSRLKIAYCIVGGYFSPIMRVFQSYKSGLVLGLNCPHGTLVLEECFNPMMRAPHSYKGILVLD